jgi:hypothetical protein
MHVQMHPAEVGKVGVVADEIRNGISAGLLFAVEWRKSSRSGAVGNCVEIGPLGSGKVAVRNSRHPNGPALIYEHQDLATFLMRTKKR